MYVGGTHQAISFIEKYKKTKQVVDFYTNEHIKKLDPETSSISSKDLEEFDLNYGDQYRSHLLTIYVGDRNKELVEDLSNLYLPFKRLFSLNSAHGSWLHSPDFLIVNLITREILCVGLGRKNRSFDFELHRYLSLRTTNDEKNIQLQEIDGSKSIDCSDEFFALDHYSISKKIINTLEELGEHYYEYDNLPGNSDVMVTRKKDGLYYLDDFEDADGMTKNEVKELENEYKNCSESIDDCLNLLKEFFPTIEDWDLNTGDY
jgi:hypothetical protein